MKKAFTLIELIIVVVIIGILALIAIPRYFANVGKATKSQVYANLDTIRQAALAYYAVYGIYPQSYPPITVIIDGETIMSVGNLNSTSWTYNIQQQSGEAGCSPNWTTYAQKQPGSTCWYALCSTGYAYQTCTP